MIPVIRKADWIPRGPVRLNPQVARFVRVAMLAPTLQTFGHISSEDLTGTYCSAVSNGVADGDARQGVSSALFDKLNYLTLTAAEKAEPMTMFGLIAGWTNTTASRLLTPSGTNFPMCAIYSAYTAPNRFVQASHRASDTTVIKCVHPTVIEPGKLYAVEVNWNPGVELAIWVNGVKASTATVKTGSNTSEYQLANVSATVSKYPYYAAAFLVGKLMDGALSRDPSLLYAPKRVWVPVSAGASSHDTTAENASGATALDTGAVTQTHVLTASDVTSAASLTTSAATSAAYTAAETAASASTLDTGAVVQTHEATAADMVSGAAATTSSVAQTHQLTAADTSSASSLTTGVASAESYTSPQTAATASSMTAPAVTQDHVLSAADAISAGLLTAAQAAQAHVVTAADVSSTSSLSSSAASSGAFTSPQTANSGGSMSSPTVAQTHLAAGSNVTSDTVLTEPAAAHVQSLTPADMVSASGLTGGTIPTGDWYYHPMWFRETVERAARFRQ